MDGEVKFYRTVKKRIPNDICIGWGHKRTGRLARKLAAENGGVPLILEDGFVGYWGHPGGTNIRLSLVKDKTGIYYDASQPSDLESLLVNQTLDSGQERRAQNLIDALHTGGIGKYNQKNKALDQTFWDDLLKGKQDYVLVVDQIWQDQSIRYGLADEHSFSKMLSAAIQENPGKLVLIKTHPDVLKKKKLGHFKNIENPNVRLVTQDISPYSLFKRATSVYTVTSQMGFEALIAGKKVVCFGMPFYAGWGLTDDRVKKPARRSRTLKLIELIHGALIDYPVYVHPVRMEACEVESILSWLNEIRNQPTDIQAVGFSPWKRAFIDRFVFPGCRVHFNNVSDIPDSDTVLCWGASRAEDLRAKRSGASVITMEDGFVRSTGLGSDLKRPSSLVMDDIGIYYDATRPSQLENILNNIALSERQQSRAINLISMQINRSVTKYNVGESLAGEYEEAIAEARKSGREVILIPGQVSSDASLTYGSPEIRGNEGLIKAVRRDFPEAFLVYKPHPDVVAGNKGDFDEQEVAAEQCDIVVTKARIDLLYPLVDKLCTLTSLAGFEGLMRGLAVRTYGIPFYSNWGLTEDIVKNDRRRRQLSLEELVYGVLVDYPTYVRWPEGRHTSVEAVIDGLAGRHVSVGSWFIGRFARKVRYTLESFLNKR